MSTKKKRKPTAAERLRRQLRQCHGEPDTSRPGYWRVYQRSSKGLKVYAPQRLVNAFMSLPCRWRITIKAKAEVDGEPDIRTAEFDINQAATIDEIRDYVQGQQTIQALEFDDPATITEQTWQVSVI